MTLQDQYTAIGHGIDGAVESQLFGKPCFKVNSKAFISFFENTMVFKLTGDAHSEALSLDGSCLFDPSKKGRAMKEWVQLPAHYEDQWKAFARDAFEYVSQLSS